MAEPWGEWVRDTLEQVSEARIAGIMLHGGISRAAALKVVAGLRRDVIVVNDLYQVNMRKMAAQKTWPAMIYLSIKRRDKQPLGVPHFRHLQRIKNELVGPQHEAIELYPAEERLVDTANQYHLWVIADPGFRFPFGFTDRMVTEDSMNGSVQQPFDKDECP